MHTVRDDLPREQLLNARLAVQAAHAVAAPSLVSALEFLQSVSANIVLPDELRAEARVAAIRVAEAAMHLETLPDSCAFNALGPQALP
jgi:hypothetical protein